MYIELVPFDRVGAIAEIERTAVHAVDDYHSPNTLGVYKPPCGQALLGAMRVHVQRYVPRQIYPCNSFGRVALHNAKLREHTDRPGLDWTVTVMLARDAPWPLKVLRRDELHVFDSTGMGVLMESGVLRHRRDPYAGRKAVQLFLHYTENPLREHDA